MRKAAISVFKHPSTADTLFKLRLKRKVLATAAARTLARRTLRLEALPVSLLAKHLGNKRQNMGMQFA